MCVQVEREVCTAAYRKDIKTKEPNDFSVSWFDPN